MKLKQTKYFSLVLCSVSAAALVAFVGPWVLDAGSGSVDLTDDFHFSSQRSTHVSQKSWMSRLHIEQVLSERLDLASPTQISKLTEHLLVLCREYRFDPAFILSLIQAESGFKVRAVSPAGAVGLMQLMPSTARVVVQDLGLPASSKLAHAPLSPQSFTNGHLMDPFVNLTLGVAYLSYLRDRYRHLPLYYLVAAYNLGPARMDVLMSRKNFKPGKTKKYFEAIQKGVYEFRTYRGPSASERRNLTG